MRWMIEVEVGEQVKEKDLQHHPAVRRMALKDSSPQLSPDAALRVQLVKEGVLKAWQKTQALVGSVSSTETPPSALYFS